MKRFWMVIVLASCVSAMASTVNVSHQGYVESRNVQITTGDYYREQMNTGRFQLLVDDVLTDAYCVEVSQSSSSENNVYSMSPVSEVYGSPQDTWLNDLYSQYHAESLTSKESAAAFQVAIWELVYENADDTSKLDVSEWIPGNEDGFLISGRHIGGIVNTANQWLRSLNGSSDVANVLRSENYQDYIAGSSVPEPATACLMLLGMLISMYKQKTNRKENL